LSLVINFMLLSVPVLLVLHVAATFTAVIPYLITDSKLVVVMF